jgi:hypothetical protein
MRWVQAFCKITYTEQTSIWQHAGNSFVLRAAVYYMLDKVVCGMWPRDAAGQCKGQHVCSRFKAD